MEIISSSESLGSRYVKELREILEIEWGEFAAFETSACGIKTPAALIAIENEILIGGLVFSLWAAPESDRTAIWINGLIIKPVYRKKGVASLLIRQAMSKEPQLLVLTDVENLYSKLSWQTISKTEKGTVLRHQV